MVGLPPLENTYHCEACDVDFRSETNIQEHEKLDLHR